MIDRKRHLTLLAILTLSLAACAPAESNVTTTENESNTTAAEQTSTTAAPTTTVPEETTMAEAGQSHGEGEPDPADVSAAALATATFQDVTMAEAAGYGSTMDALGCFESAEQGGMGLHYLNESLMDGEVDVTTPEALVYELNASGDIVGLVAHEYIVPIEAWTDAAAPTLFGVEFHQHPVLPLWVLHTWIWKDNPAGFFSDWNPKVRLCPEGVPIFGVDLP